MEIIFLTLEEIELLHFHQIERYGGLAGLRDKNLLESAVNYPQAMFGGHYLHEDVYHMAAAYMYAIIKNHPFVDGNKRTGFSVALLFLAYNDIFIDVQEQKLFDLTIAVATGNISEDAIAIFFREQTVNN